MERSELQQQLTPALAKDSALFGASAVDKVQAAWIQYRDNECELEQSPYEGGTIQPLIYGECEVALTVQRLQEVLKSIAGVCQAGQ
jgi:uncharacterized protein YecT (DUF1311 family)